MTERHDHSFHDLPVDPDVEIEEGHHWPPSTAREALRRHPDVLLVIALGGALGSLGRWALGELLPHAAGGFAWSTFTVNVSGALLLGLLMGVLLEMPAHHRYLRPLLGTGVLGGWTTFSTAMLDGRTMLAEGHAVLGLLGYLGGTLLVGLACVVVGVIIGRRVAPRSGAAA